MRLAFLTPAPDFPEEWRWAFDVEAAALIDAGASVDPVPWTTAAELSGYDLILPLVAWGYHQRPAQWRALLDRFEERAAPVLNPPAVLRWSSDKDYLAELGAKGVPTIPTLVTDALDEGFLDAARQRFGKQRLVVKPTVSAGAYGTFRLDPGEAVPDMCRGQRMIIQPFIEAIASHGEYSLILFDGVLSHAVVKTPKAGDFRVQPHLGGTTTPCDPPAGGEELARMALAAAPGEALYARVDMVRDDDGQLRIMELELVEPALFLDHSPDGGAAFTRAILSAAA
jgi:glutathione synthase/RimK-type ligase-like ATP-grasp enzyme